MIINNRYEQGWQEVGYFQLRQLEHVEGNTQDHDTADGIQFPDDIGCHEGHDEGRQQIEKALIDEEDDTDGNDAQAVKGPKNERRRKVQGALEIEKVMTPQCRLDRAEDGHGADDLHDG